MPQDPTPTPEPQSQDPTPVNPEDAEKAYWEKFEGKLDTWFDKKIEKYRTTGTARMGKTTLPEIVANFVFGKQEGK